MTRSQVMELLKQIALAYPVSFRLDAETAKEQAELWHSFLKDAPVEVVYQNLKDHIRSERLPPTIADLLPKRPLADGPYVPSVEETREWIRQEDERIRRYEEERARDPEAWERRMREMREEVMRRIRGVNDGHVH